MHVHICTSPLSSCWWCAGKQVLKCLLSPDVRQLATASADKTIKLWNLDGFTLDRTLTGISHCHTVSFQFRQKFSPWQPAQSCAV